MIRRVIILTLSLKHGDYCIAAYDADSNKMIRLVKDASRENGIPKQCAQGVHLLDEVDVNIVGCCPKEHQTENVVIDLSYGMQKTGRRVDIKTIYNNLQKHPRIFGGNNYKVLNVDQLDHSLEIIKFENMHVQKKFINEKSKTKANFVCNSQIHLNYSVTDARFFDDDLLIPSGYSIISLPVTDDYAKQHGYFKYVSAIYPD